MSLIIIFLFGLAVGSFLNVLIDRTAQEKSILGRSHCDTCKKAIAWHDLFPFVSFLILKGKCRFCKAEIGFRTPFVELITGLLFVAVVLHNFSPVSGNLEIFSILRSIEVFAEIVVLTSLLAIFFIDLDRGIIPDIIVFPMIAVVFVSLFFNSQLPASPAGGSTLNFIFSAFGAFLLFLFLFVITKGRGMGFGDVKLVFLLGLFLGFPGIAVALYLSFVMGAIVGLLLITLKRKTLKQTVPFGPFLVIGTLLAFFYQNAILRILPF